MCNFKTTTGSMVSRTANAGKTLTYWKCKLCMATKTHFRWKLLEYCIPNGISQEDHTNTHLQFINDRFCLTCHAWGEIWKLLPTQREQFLNHLADDYAKRNNIMSIKALKAIKQSEHSCMDFVRIQSIMGLKKDKNPLTLISTLDMINNKLQI